MLPSAAQQLHQRRRQELVAGYSFPLFFFAPQEFFLAPLAGSVPATATAPALVYVATLMLREFAEITWDDVTEAAPAVLTAIAMPFTYSIANGLAFGFVTYAGLKLLTGRAREVHAATWIVAALFVMRFVFFPQG